MGKCTDEQKRRLLDLIEKWKVRLGLQHWTIDVRWDEQPADENAMLSITVIDGRQFAIIRVGTFFDQRPEEHDNAVCHELVHCILEPFWREVELLAWSTLRSEEYNRMHGILRRHMERAVDHLATVLAPIDHADGGA